jgi:spore coat protein JB
MKYMKPSRQQLYHFINEVSFAVNDINLYLDTHPCDQDALAYFAEYSSLREQALLEYAQLYGPLTLNTAAETSSNTWQWAMQPWPWEGGNC